MGEPAADGTGEWRAGWALVLAAAFGTSLGAIHIYSTGLFIAPLEQEFGWSRATISAGLSITAVLGVLFSPLFGYFVDLWGPRRIALAGTLIYCTAIAMLSLAGASALSWLGLWVIVGIGTLFLKPTVWSAAVSSMFTRNRGLALALMLCGTGIASSLVPILANALIDRFGWRGGYIGLGTIFIVIVFPMLYFFFFGAFDRARLRPRDNVAAPAKPPAGWTARQGFRSRQFYQLGAASVIATGVLVGYVVHLVSILVEAGLTRGQAVGLAGLSGIMSVSARLFVGFLFDRTASPLVGAISLALPLVPALLLLGFPGSFTAAAAAVVILGLSTGGEHDTIIYLSSRHFGMRAFGTLFGFIASGFLAGVGLGPLIAGWIFDSTGSYTLFLMLVIPLSLLAGLIVGTLGPYPDHEANAATEKTTAEREVAAADPAIPLGNVAEVRPA